MKLYILRHGQTEWNVARRLQGWKNSDLTETGINHARLLAEKLKEIDFDLIYTSTQKRAIDTANIIKGNRKIETIAKDDLREIGFGKWEGMEIQRINEVYPEEYGTYKTSPQFYKPIDGESFDQIYSRVNRVLDEIICQRKKNILLVSHGVTIRVLTAIIKNIPLEKINQIEIQEGTALSICKLGEKGLEFIIEGDTSHME